MQRQRPGHRILSFHHRGLLLLVAAVAVMLFFLYGCVAGAAYSPRGRLVFIPLAQVSGDELVQQELDDTTAYILS